MFIIVGLGNPGLKYEGTRHNVGFDVIDKIAEEYHIAVDTRKHRALIGRGVIDGFRVILAKPQTFMNLSGESIRELVDYYKVDEETDLIVIYDDISLDLRIKIGVGEKPRGYDLADYVLGHFEGEDKEKMEEAYEKAVQAVRMALHGDVCEAMNQFNRKG